MVSLMSSESNVTLGLGLNRVMVFIVDSPTTTDDERRVINVYTLTIYRQGRFTPPSPTHGHPDTAAAPSPEACRLLQVGNTT